MALNLNILSDLRSVFRICCLLYFPLSFSFFRKMWTYVYKNSSAEAGEKKKNRKKTSQLAVGALFSFEPPHLPTVVTNIRCYFWLSDIFYRSVMVNRAERCLFFCVSQKANFLFISYKQLLISYWGNWAPSENRRMWVNVLTAHSWHQQAGFFLHYYYQCIFATGRNWYRVKWGIISRIGCA